MMLALQSMTMVEPRNTSGSPAKSLLTASDEFVFLIEEVPRKLRRMFDASTARFGLTRTQWRALVYIYRTPGMRSEEHTSELQSLMRNSYAVFCLKKKKTHQQNLS